MDFSAKQLKKLVTEQQKSVTKSHAIRSKPTAVSQKLHGNAQSKEAKDFIESNAAHIYKSALEQRTHCKLDSVNYALTPWENKAISNWWDHIDILQSLHDRGFTIVDDDPKHFGAWYSSIAILETHEAFELENFLVNRLSEVTRSRPRVAVQQLLKSFLHSNDSRINILRLLVLFNRLWSQYDVNTDNTFEFVNKILPLDMGRHSVDMDWKTENFSISWRYPNEGVNPSDGVSATVLKWLCSNAGNEQFRKLYAVIKANVTAGNARVESVIETSDEGFVVFLDKGLKNISLELSSSQLKHLLVSLDYVVAINKGSTPHSLSIGL
ncbi:hypothetical protein MCERE10_03654 [Burkholderiaceae bacterium]